MDYAGSFCCDGRIASRGPAEEGDWKDKMISEETAIGSPMSVLNFMRVWNCRFIVLMP